MQNLLIKLLGFKEDDDCIVIVVFRFFFSVVRWLPLNGFQHLFTGPWAFLITSLVADITVLRFMWFGDTIGSTFV